MIRDGANVCYDGTLGLSWMALIVAVIIEISVVRCLNDERWTNDRLGTIYGHIMRDAAMFQ